MLAVRTPANQLATAPVVDVDLYGVVSNDSWDEDRIGVDTVLKALEGLKPEQSINLHINSVGGMVSEGVTIYNRLKALPNNKTVIIEGLAASIASVIAMAGDTVHMALGSQMMIHNPSVFAYGDSAEMRKAAEMLDSTKEALIDIYEARTNLERENISQMMDAETWLTSKAALEKGFCDTVDDGLEMVACVRGTELVVNGVAMAINALQGLPVDKYINVAAEAAEGEEMELTLDILKTDHADIYNAAVEEGRKQERERLQALDEISTESRAEIINKAKYETLQNAQEVAVELLKATNPVADMLADAKDASNALTVPTSTAKEKEITDQDRAMAMVDKFYAGGKK